MDNIRIYRTIWTFFMGVTPLTEVERGRLYRIGYFLTRLEEHFHAIPSSPGGRWPVKMVRKAEARVNVVLTFTRIYYIAPVGRWWRVDTPYSK
jgi:hypothetical protein